MCHFVTTTTNFNTILTGFYIDKVHFNVSGPGSIWSRRYMKLFPVPNIQDRKVPGFEVTNCPADLVQPEGSSDFT